MGSRAGEGRTQRKFWGAPIKILRRAREFYMKCMMDCGGMVDQEEMVGGGGGGGPTVPLVSNLPKSFTFSSANSSKSRNEEEEDEYVGLLGLISNNRRSDNCQEMGSDLHNRKEIKVKKQNGMGRRSYSVGLGKIDEEKPCSFREEAEHVEEENAFLRSRSSALRRNIVYYK